MAENTLAKVMEYVVRALRPLVDEFSTPDQTMEFMARIGLNPPGVPTQSIANLVAALQALIQALADWQVEVQASGEASDAATQKLMDLGVAATVTFGAILDFGQQLQNEFSAYPDFLSQIDFGQVARRLLDESIIQFAASEFPQIYNLLVLLGLFELAYESPFPTPADNATEYEPLKSKRAFLRRTIRDDRIQLLFQSPDAVARDLYGWGTPQFETSRILGILQFLGWSLGLDAYLHPSLPLNPTDEVTSEEVRYPLFELIDQAAAMELGLALLPVPATSVGSDAGLALRPYGSGQVGTTISLGQHWALGLKAELDLNAGLALVLRPPLQPAISVSTGSAAYRLDADLTWAKPDGSRVALLSVPDWLKLDAAGFTLGVGFGGNTQGQTEFHVEGQLNEGALLITAGKGDSFLKKVLPPEGLKAIFELGVGWSNLCGVYFKGSGGFEVTLPVHIDLFGVLTIDSIYVAALAQSSGEIKTHLALSAGLKLGPLAAAVERIGATVLISFPPGGGNLGSANAEFKFKPPNGLGLVLDVGVVVGGGYLFFDPDNAKYAGVLQLWIAQKIAITAIGLLTTRMPDGSDGFSLLILLCVEFPPIQLGFGFTLNGLGGLLGVNRTMVLDALRAGVKNRTLNSILFPKDPIKNAAKIISDLTAIYPPAQGRFVFGPMAILGWGSPEPLLKIELGVVLEVPSPVRLAILGRITLALPNEKAALVLIHLDILGAIDFDKGDASLDATLYDSRVVQFVITGDMAMRLNWGAHPLFLMAAGGFHPHFPGPPNFPALNRLAISLATGDNPRLRLESYLATTSNTVQFGARLDLYVAVKAGILGTFSAAAYFSLDALVQFKPFWFQVDISAAAVIKHNNDVIFSVKLDFSLSGPNPWHAWGEASFQFLGTHRIPFDFTLPSDEPAPPLPEPVDPLPELVAAVGDARSWSAQLPAEAEMVVSLKKIDPSQDILVHPFGSLTVRQKVLPLDVEIRKFGSSPLAAPQTYSITQVKVGSQTVSLSGGLTDAFAPGQYFDLSEDEKMSRPSFEYLNSGFTNLGTPDLSYAASQKIRTEFDYETVLVDAKDKPPRPAATYSLAQALFEALAPLGAAGQAAIRQAASQRFKGPSQNIRVKEPAYVVASKNDLTSAPGQQAKTYTEAKQAQEKQAEAGQAWQVVASHEVQP